MPFQRRSKLFLQDNWRSDLSISTSAGKDVLVPAEDRYSVAVTSHLSKLFRIRNVPNSDGACAVTHRQMVAFASPAVYIQRYQRFTIIIISSKV